MNERIKELAEMATEYVQHGFTTQETYFNKEKFAELIVQECIDKIETYNISVGNSAAGVLALEWTYGALKEIRDDIKETFGVE